MSKPKPTAREWIAAHLDDHPDPASLKKACVAALGISECAARKAYNKLARSTPGIPAARTAPSGSRTAAFRAQYDKSYYIAAAVKKGIAEHLRKPGVEWATDDDFRKQCGITNPADWKTYARENPDFAANQVITPDRKTVWAKTPAYAEELRRMALS